MMNRALRQLLLGLFLLSVNVAGAKTQTLWIYASVYKEYLSELEKAFEKKHPQIDVQVFQGGSEKLQSKVEAEILSKKPLADMVMVSGPIWVQDLEARGLIAERQGRKAVETNYYSAMVLIAHNQFPKEKRPSQFSDLSRPEFKNLIQMGSPLESGTAFIAVSLLAETLGWDYFKKLKENKIGSSGGNATVIQKVESGEKKVGMVLLENALAAVDRKSPIDIIYPQEGTILIPSVQAILKHSSRQESAALFADFVLSKEGQEILRKGYMYSVRQDVKAPEGALSFAELNKKAQRFSEVQMKDIASKAKSIKKSFREIIME